MRKYPYGDNNNTTTTVTRTCQPARTQRRFSGRNSQQLALSSFYTVHLGECCLLRICTLHACLHAHSVDSEVSEILKPFYVSFIKVIWSFGEIFTCRHAHGVDAQRWTCSNVNYIPHETLPVQQRDTHTHVRTHTHSHIHTHSHSHIHTILTVCWCDFRKKCPRMAVCWH